MLRQTVLQQQLRLSLRKLKFPNQKIKKGSNKNNTCVENLHDHVSIAYYTSPYLKKELKPTSNSFELPPEL
jgi:hypothetical protein